MGQLAEMVRVSTANVFLGGSRHVPNPPLDTGRQGIVDQDIAIASYIAERGRSCIIVLNKWDLIPNISDAVSSYVNLVRERFNFLAFARKVLSSCW